MGLILTANLTQVWTLLRSKEFSFIFILKERYIHEIQVARTMKTIKLLMFNLPTQVTTTKKTKIVNLKLAGGHDQAHTAFEL